MSKEVEDRMKECHYSHDCVHVCPCGVQWSSHEQQKEIAQLKGRIEFLEELRDAKTATIGDKDKEIVQLREEMESRNTVVVSLRTECEARISQLNIARSNWDSCQGKLGNIERVLNEYRNEETDIITNIEEWNGEFTSLRTQVATLTQENERLNQLGIERDKAVYDAEQQNADLKAACESDFRVLLVVR